MKHLIYILLPLSLAALALTGCQTEEIDVFSTDDALVYFQRISYTTSNGQEGYATNTKYSFVGASEKMTQVTLKEMQYLLILMLFAGMNILLNFGLNMLTLMK